MAPKVSFDENGVRRIVAAVRKVEQTVLPAGKFSPSIGSGTPQNWRPAYNASGETIPAYSCVRIETGSTLDGVAHVNAEKPSATFSRDYGLSPGVECEAGGRVGVCFEAGFAAYDTGTPATGETWGPKPGQFTVSKNYPGFRCLGVIDSTNKIMLAVREEPPFYLCKADSAISKGSTGTASVYVGASGSETDSTVNITSCRAKWMAIATSKWCGVSFVNGVPYITQLEC